MSAVIQKFLKVGVICAALMTVGARSEATTYYIDYSSGNDSNVGTSTGTPFKHCPGDPAASGSVPAFPSVGDVIYFKGGIPYYASNAPIYLTNGVTYDGNSAGNWGTGRALLSANWTGANAVGMRALASISGTTIKYFEFYGFGGSQSLPADTGSAVSARPGIGILADALASNFTVDNCYFHELGYWFNQKPMDINSVDGQAVFLHGINNVLITNCTFEKISASLEMATTADGTTNLFIANCLFGTYMRWGIDEARNSNGVHTDNVFIHDNIWSNYDFAYAGTQWSGYGGAPHVDGWFNRGDGISYFYDGKTLNFYNNTYINTLGESGASGWVYCEGGTSCNCYNNVVIGNPTYAFRVYVDGIAGGMTNFTVRVLNNSQYSAATAMIYFGGLNYQIRTDAGDSILFENNISVLTLTGVYYIAAMTTNLTNNFPAVYSQNYNLYYAWPFNASPVTFINGWQPTLAQTRSNFGWDANSMSANPLFVSLSPLDLHLQTNSPAIGAGVNLTSLGLPGLNQDKDGNPRPPIGAWTIGAYASIDSTLLPYVSLVATPDTIVKGQSVILTWMSLNATNLSLAGIGPVATDGSTNVVPLKNGTTYVMTAMGMNGTSTAMVSVTVKPPPPVQLPPQ